MAYMRQIANPKTSGFYQLRKILINDENNTMNGIYCEFDSWFKFGSRFGPVMRSTLNDARVKYSCNTSILHLIGRR